jgi:hypothetical protein
VDAGTRSAGATARTEDSSNGRGAEFAESCGSRKGFRLAGTDWLAVDFDCADFDVGRKEDLLKAFAITVSRAFDGEGSTLMARRLFEGGAGDGTERDLFLGETVGGAKAAVKEGFAFTGDLVTCGRGEGLVRVLPDLAGNGSGPDGVAGANIMSLVASFGALAGDLGTGIADRRTALAD